MRKHILAALVAVLSLSAAAQASDDFRRERQVGEARIQGGALTGRPVSTADGRDLGAVGRVLVDDAGYLVTLGVPAPGRDGLVAVPADQVRLSGEGGVVIGVPADQLAQLPEFSNETPVINGR